LPTLRAMPLPEQFHAPIAGAFDPVVLNIPIDLHTLGRRKRGPYWHESLARSIVR
jgi:hypothetical protein